MSVEQSRIVDFISIRKADGRVVLTVSDHLPFNGDGQRILTLQEKINDYLAFIESGQLYDHCPKAHSKEIEISVVFKHTPDDSALEFLRVADETIRSAGFHFSFETFNDNTRDA